MLFCSRTRLSFRQLSFCSSSKSLMSSFSAKENPLLASWSSCEFELPPFDLIKPQHYKDAISLGFSQHLKEIKDIAEVADEPNFDNTIAAYDRAGGVLTRVLNVFHNQCSSNVNPDLQSVELAMAGPLAEHDSVVITFPGVFPRVAAVYDSLRSSDCTLNPEQIRLTERIHLDFIRAGAKFSPESQLSYKRIVMRLAELMTQFAQNVLADEASYTLELTSQQLGGLPTDLIDGAKQAATERKLPSDTYAITLSRSLVEPFLTYSDHRDLREKAWRAWISRFLYCTCLVSVMHSCSLMPSLLRLLFFYHYLPGANLILREITLHSLLKSWRCDWSKLRCMVTTVMLLMPPQTRWPRRQMQ